MQISKKHTDVGASYIHDVISSKKTGGVKNHEKKEYLKTLMIIFILGVPLNLKWDKLLLLSVKQYTKNQGK
ncbi:MAG: hypothetical protein A2W90_09630 [Bacteroidetes bacterium GWF2_42_66]|nr:MAG: hypothetical protein A2W92_17350 [Bacteroidetes bacterium GWA2_42_15]OFX97575.1 MAG: hypothetical protein A2W89_01775 [Bacteroidetes bacterium GWE2_42_39]OFY43730.1 MAG: hypothetical protein A2W90_09630 [Bacteroidetes bacterium GWF2_42_66]HBL76294.1 hypothetical protein [Prolixibacteraceae bacterium]HCR92221.1 hypothetical protein [Prolixibacteraceae bacterium]